jgi:hypothetical protein
MNLQDQVSLNTGFCQVFKCAVGFVLTALLTGQVLAQDESNDAENKPAEVHSESYPIPSGLPIDAIPDLNDTKSKRKIFGKNLIIVPIPMSIPTFGTGLILGGAYFYPQTDEQKKVQPASMNLIYQPAQNVRLGMELLWGERRNKDDTKGTATQLQISARYDF